MNDVLAGHFDLYGPNVGSPGALGTYADVFLPYFQEPGRLLDNVVARLSSGWYGQNYIGKYLMAALPMLATTPVRKARLITALRSGVRNDAKILIRAVDSLPRDWQEAINRVPEPPDDDVPF